MILYLTEALEPKGGELIQDCAFVWNRIWQDHIKRGWAIGGDEEQRFPEIKNFAHLSAAQFFDTRKIEKGLWSGRHTCDIITTWLESSSNRAREFCMDTTGFFAAKC